MPNGNQVRLEEVARSSNLEDLLQAEEGLAEGTEAELRIDLSIPQFFINTYNNVAERFGVNRTLTRVIADAMNFVSIRVADPWPGNERIAFVTGPQQISLRYIKNQGIVAAIIAFLENPIVLRTIFGIAIGGVVTLILSQVSNIISEGRLFIQSPAGEEVAKEITGGVVNIAKSVRTAVVFTSLAVILPPLIQSFIEE